MNVIARGYLTPYPQDVNIVSLMSITPQQAEDHDGLRPDLWWEFEYIPNRWDRLVARIPSRPTRTSRYIGACLVLLGLVLVMGIAGGLER